MDHLDRPSKTDKWSRRPPVSVTRFILVLCIAILVGCRASSDETSVRETPVLEPTAASETAQSYAGEVQGTRASDSLSVNRNGDSDEEALVSDSEPEFGEITFALGITDQYEPIDPGFFFAKGITEVHAIFEYRGMSPAHTWERVWYLNEQEVSRTSGAWTGPASGVFDYFIDNDGQPLPAGDWILELYVEGKLHSLGVFIIDTD